MSWAMLAAFGLFALLLIVFGLVTLVRRSRKPDPKEEVRADPDKPARFEDRRRQQKLLAELSGRLPTAQIPEGLWTARGSNPITRRTVLEFESWRPVDPNGKRRKRRSSRDTPIEGPIWPYILSIDLHGLPVDVALEVTTVSVELAAELGAGRVRMITGHGKRRAAGMSPVREALITAMRDRGNEVVEYQGHLDISADGRPV